jgi:hypothetical protein
LKIDGSRLALVLAGRESKWNTVVVNTLLDKEGNTVDSGTKYALCYGAGANSCCSSGSRGNSDA